MNWEKQLEELREITEELKDEQTSLEDSIALFEKGVKITKEIEKRLQQAEQKISVILNSVDDEGELSVEPFEGER
ncbi:MAG: exodeoxyribonuclease VII small subunit [Sphaerochaetaceae bacterium]|nr:exodeoxyribonuclease VII small subunit [Sphaerochaetaceae bacterium]